MAGTLDFAERFFICHQCDLYVGLDGYRRILDLVAVEERLRMAEEAIDSGWRTSLELRRIVEMERIYLEGISGLEDGALA